MKNCVFLVLDNLRVGGVQRLALDEAYSLAKRGIQVRIYFLENAIDEDDIRKIDSKYLTQYRATIEFISIKSGTFKQIARIRVEIARFRPFLIVSHSAKGILLCRIAEEFSLVKEKSKIVGFIHQLITLSDSLQKFKRLLFFRFADELRASSKQFVLEIEKVRRRNPLWRVINNSRIEFDRMGIDLDRIKFDQGNVTYSGISELPTLIFLSRVVGWKGFQRFLDISNMWGNKARKFLLTTPLYRNTEEVKKLTESKNSYVAINKGIAQFSFGPKSVHIYPVNYGDKIFHPQNIGLNVLECLSLGIPSLISPEKFWSWPELEESPLIRTTDWNQQSVHEEIRRLSLIPEDVRRSESKRLSKIISIDKHIDRLLNGVEAM